MVSFHFDQTKVTRASPPERGALLLLLGSRGMPSKGRQKHGRGNGDKHASGSRGKKAGKVSVVVPGELLVGNQFVSADAAALRALGITAVLAIGCRQQHPESEFAFYHVGAQDRANTDIISELSGATAWARGHVTRGGRVLVHCKAGISRSPAFAIAYLMRYHGHTMATATGVVVEARPIAKPRPHFLDQVATWAAAGFTAAPRRAGSVRVAAAAPAAATTRGSPRASSTAGGDTRLQAGTGTGAGDCAGASGR